MLPTLFKSTRLNSVSVITIGGIIVRFWHFLHELENFCGIMQ